MRQQILLSLVVSLLLFLSSVLFGAPRRGIERLPVIQAKFRIGTSVDVKTTKIWAQAHLYSQITPKKAYKSLKAAIVKRDRAKFLELLEPGARLAKYPRGLAEYIKYVDHFKYFYLAIFSKITRVTFTDQTGLTAELYVDFYKRVRGRVVVSPKVFTLKRIGVQWFFTSW